jgi:Tfp pilus assembly protein PilF
LRDNLTLYKAAVQSNPRSAVAFNNLAIEYTRMGLSNEAEAAYKKALSLSQSVYVQTNGRVNLARIYLGQKQYKEAMKELDEALQIKADFSTIYQIYGFIYREMGQYDKAAAMWERGLHFSPRSAEIMESMGMMYLHNKELEKAKHYLKEAIRVQFDRYSAYFNLGQVFQEESDFVSAIEAYRKSLEFNPEFASAHYCLGTLYAQQQDKRSLWHLKEAVRLKPFFADAHNNLAVLYASLVPPRIGLAREHARKALESGYPVEKAFLQAIGLSQDAKGLPRKE